MILIGSAAEHGRPKNSKNWFGKRPMAPNTVYGLSKQKQTLNSSLFAANGINVKVARLFNLYGPKMNNRLLMEASKSKFMRLSWDCS